MQKPFPIKKSICSQWIKELGKAGISFIDSRKYDCHKPEITMTMTVFYHLCICSFIERFIPFEILPKNAFCRARVVHPLRRIKKDTSQSSCFRDFKSTFWGSSWERLKELQKTKTLPLSQKSLINLFRFYDKTQTRYQKQ